MEGEFMEISEASYQQGLTITVKSKGYSDWQKYNFHLQLDRQQPIMLVKRMYHYEFSIPVYDGDKDTKNDAILTVETHRKISSSPIKGYTFKKKYEFPHNKLNKNMTMESFLDSSKNLKVKLRNRNNSFVFSDKSKKFITGEISNVKINKSNNGIFSSYNKLTNHDTKNSKSIKISLYPGKNKTIFQKIIENLDKLKQNNQKTYELIKKNEKKTIRLRLKKFNYLKDVKTKTKNEISKVKEESDTSNKLIKNETSQKENKTNKTNQIVEEEKKNIEPEPVNNMSLSIKKDINLLNSNINKESTAKTNFTTNMYHIRNLFISKEQIQSSFIKAGIVTILWKKTLFIRGIEMQMNDISNKTKLILDNIDYFKVNYFNNGNFFLGFENMDNYKKAEFNLTLEELCFLLIETVPKLLQKFYDSLDRILYIKIPDLDKEMEKIPKNEKECLDINCAFLNQVALYFMGCVDVLKEIQKRIDYYKFKDNEFLIIDNFLDLARYDTSKINSMAEIYIDRMRKEEKIMEKMEVGLGIRKKKKYLVEDIFERIHKRYTQSFKDEIKLERINSTLNLKGNTFLNDAKRNKFILMRRAQNLNILNQPVVTALMKYFKDNIKSQIISEQVFERFKLKEKQSQKKVVTKNDE